MVGSDFSRASCSCGAFMVGVTRILVLGVGNPLLSDDRVGLRVAELLQARPPRPPDGTDIVVDTGLQGGLEFTEKLSGYERAIVVDSIKTGRHQVGEIVRLSPEDLQETTRLLTSHGVGLLTAVEFGRAAGLRMPDEITVFGIEVADNLTVSEQMDPRVAAAAEQLAALVRGLIAEGLPSSG